MNEIYKSDEFEYYHRLEEFPNYAISNWGNLININNGHIRKWGRDKDDYIRTSIYFDGERKTVKCAHLVLKTFGEKKLNDGKEYTCDHIDRNKNNNKISNLRWADKSEQVQNRNPYGKLKQKFIMTDRQHYRVHIKYREEKNICRRFKTLEDAIQFRNKYCTENNIKYE